MYTEGGVLEGWREKGRRNGVGGGGDRGLEGRLQKG